MPANVVPVIPRILRDNEHVCLEVCNNNVHSIEVEGPGKAAQCLMQEEAQHCPWPERLFLFTTSGGEL